MVKGTSKRVIVVKSPDPKIFEQAIFIVREDLSGSGGADPSEVLREAQRVADEYIRSSLSGPPSLLSRIPPPAFLGIGAGMAGAVWLVLRMIGI